MPADSAAPTVPFTPPPFASALAARVAQLSGEAGTHEPRTSRASSTASAIARRRASPTSHGEAVILIWLAQWLPMLLLYRLARYKTRLGHTRWARWTPLSCCDAVILS